MAFLQSVETVMGDFVCLILELMFGSVLVLVQLDQCFPKPSVTFSSILI